MTLEVIGANHVTSPLAMREKLAVPPDRLGGALREFSEACSLSELAILSTCNRVEFYFRQGDAGARLGHYIAEAAGLSRDAVRENVYYFRGAEAIRHLFTVAAGLDSMALGETEVLAQCKCAYDAAVEAGTTGCVLNCLFQRAFGAAKRVHSLTGVSKGKTSVGSVAAALVTRELGTLAGRKVLVIGAGAMAENALSHIAALGSPEIIVANRTPARGAALAGKFGGRAVGLDRIKGLLSEAQVIITSTSGAKYLLTKKTLAAARKGRSEPLFVLDISVPRNVEPAAGSLPKVRLFNIDDLKGLANANRAGRKAELRKAASVIDEEVAAFTKWLASRQVVPVVRALKTKASDIEEREVAAAVRNIRKGAAPEAEMRKLARRMASSLLHHPLSALRRAAADGEDADRLSRAARELHGIEGDDQQ